MDKRLLAVLAALGAAAVVVGLSTAATSTSRSDSVQKPKRANDVKVAKKTARPSTPPVVVVKSLGADADAATYWTPERMNDAQPLEKTVPNGSPSSAPAVSGGSAPSGAPTKSTPTGKSTTTTKAAKNKRSRAASNPGGGLTRSPETDDAAGYWTQEKMDDAQPTEQSVPGGDATGGSALPDPGGGTAPGVP